MKTIIQLAAMMALVGTLFTGVPPGAVASTFQGPVASQSSAPIDAIDPRLNNAISALERAGSPGKQLANLARLFSSTGGTIAYSNELPVNRSASGYIKSIQLGNTSTLPLSNAFYDPSTDRSQGTIKINELLATMPPEVSAAVLSHELAHAFQLSGFGPYQTSGTPEACLVSEFQAWQVAENVWMAIAVRATADDPPDTPTLIATLNNDEMLMQEFDQLINWPSPGSSTEVLRGQLILTTFVQRLLSNWGSECTTVPANLQWYLPLLEPKVPANR